MTIQELYQSSLFTFAQQPDNERFSNDFYNAINESQDEFCNQPHKWGCLRTSGSVTTTTSTRGVSLPNNFGSFFDEDGAIRVSSPSTSVGNTIELITASQYYADHYDADAEDEPTYCWREGDTLNFSYIPDAEYTVTFLYYKRPTAVGNTKDSLTIPTRYHELLKKLIFRRLQVLGYTAVQEISISDSDIERYYGMAAQNDIAEYGGLVFNLPSSTYKIETT